MSKVQISSLKDFLSTHKNYIVQEINRRLSLLPKSPYRELQLQTRGGEHYLNKWVDRLIGALAGNRDFFLINQERAAELISIQAFGLDFAFQYYNIFQEILRELLKKMAADKKLKHLNLYEELQELNNILLQGFNCIANFYIKTRDDRINKILHLQKLSNFHREMLKEPLSKRERLSSF